MLKDQMWHSRAFNVPLSPLLRREESKNDLFGEGGSRRFLRVSQSSSEPASWQAGATLAPRSASGLNEISCSSPQSVSSRIYDPLTKFHRITGPKFQAAAEHSSRTRRSAAADRHMTFAPACHPLCADYVCCPLRTGGNSCSCRI